mmetsp:Transcript_32402/g.76222  ORF Transcript_32402/g.76222 Transcript_32402/m.76222 type:complete len:220 (+) Transcript_32402:744-1403(+)
MMRLLLISLSDFLGLFPNLGEHLGATGTAGRRFRILLGRRFDSFGRRQCIFFLGIAVLRLGCGRSEQDTDFFVQGRLEIFEDLARRCRCTIRRGKRSPGSFVFQWGNRSGVAIRRFVLLYLSLGGQRRSQRFRETRPTLGLLRLDGFGNLFFVQQRCRIQDHLKVFVVVGGGSRDSLVGSLGHIVSLGNVHRRRVGVRTHGGAEPGGIREHKGTRGGVV